MTGSPVHDVNPLPPVGPDYELLGPWWTFDAPSLRVADRRHEYVSIWSAGDVGPSVLLVPAATEDHHVWEPLLPALTEHFVVHALDTRDRDRDGADVDGVHTALASVGASRVIARGDSATAVLTAVRTVNVDRIVVWDAPADGSATERVTPSGASWGSSVRWVKQGSDVSELIGALLPDDSPVGVRRP